MPLGNVEQGTAVSWREDHPRKLKVNKKGRIIDENRHPKHPKKVSGNAGQTRGRAVISEPQRSNTGGAPPVSPEGDDERRMDDQGSGMIVITCNMPEMLLKPVDLLVRHHKLYPSRSELTRVALREFLYEEMKTLQMLKEGVDIIRPYAPSDMRRMPFKQQRLKHP
jgi:Arc/MetJ-type ribon-helix-helix transcriptional regulator